MVGHHQTSAHYLTAFLPRALLGQDFRRSLVMSAGNPAIFLSQPIAAAFIIPAVLSLIAPWLFAKPRITVCGAAGRLIAAAAGHRRHMVASGHDVA